VRSLPLDWGLSLLETVYGFPVTTVDAGRGRLEFSIHPKPRGWRRGRTLMWEYVVRNIKRHTAGRIGHRKFKTIECWIMDLADDIAYSTYDLEDSMKAGFLSPASILASKDDLLSKVADKTSEEIGRAIAPDDVLDIFSDIFAAINADGSENSLLAFVETFRASQALSESGYFRTKLSSQLVHEAINSVEVKLDSQYPMLSEAYLNEEARLKVEVLKQ
jgi:dGTPase